VLWYLRDVALKANTIGEATMRITEFFTTTGVAKHYTAKGYPLKSWQIRRAYERELICEPEMRFGQYRVISADDLPLLEKALAKLGYLPDTFGVAA
jgi:hypothetical protein